LEELRGEVSTDSVLPDEPPEEQKSVGIVPPSFKISFSAIDEPQNAPEITTTRRTMFSQKLDPILDDSVCCLLHVGEFVFSGCGNGQIWVWSAIVSQTFFLFEESYFEINFNFVCLFHQEQSITISIN
jgi:hypothetical protein